MEAGVSVNAVPDIARKENNRLQWIPLYVSGVTGLGIAVILVAFRQLPADRLGLVLFAALAAVTELSRVELFRSSRSGVSVSSVMAVASILLFGPLAGALAHMASGVAMAVLAPVLQRNKVAGGRASWLERSAFNIGMLVTAAAAAGWVYVTVGGTPGVVQQLSNLLPLAAAATADTLVNVIILIGVIALQTGRRPSHIWRQDIQWGVPISVAVGVVGGGSVALAYEMFGVLGLAVFLVPVLATSYSFRLYVDNMKVYVDKLEQANLDLEEANLSLLETMGAVIDAYDVYTYGHSAQVSIYAGAIARKMDLPPEEQAALVRAALVHDIGKVGVVDSLVGKPGDLTDEEYNIVKRHAIIGAEIVGRMRGLGELVPLVRHHHERWDGNGYPDGLAGEAIPLGARVLALADSLDAMLSDRPHRPTRSFKAILDTVMEKSGTQFDPDVVNAFLSVVEEEDKGFFKNSAATVDRRLRVNGRGAGADGVRYFLKKSLVVNNEV